MNKETEELLNRLFASPARRAADTPPRALSKEGPICDMSDDQKLFAARFVSLWMTMAALACDTVKKLAALADRPKTAETAERRRLYLQMLNEVLDAMQILNPLIDAVGKYGLKHSLLDLQITRCEAAIDDLEFVESLKAELQDA